VRTLILTHTQHTAVEADRTYLIDHNDRAIGGGDQHFHRPTECVPRFDTGPGGGRLDEARIGEATNARFAKVAHCEKLPRMSHHNQASAPNEALVYARPLTLFAQTKLEQNLIASEGRQACTGGGGGGGDAGGGDAGEVRKKHTTASEE
jgi:hypothetical protein